MYKDKKNRNKILLERERVAQTFFPICWVFLNAIDKLNKVKFVMAEVRER